MAKKICLQAGHQNVKHNSIVALRGSTGAPNEMSFNVDIRNRVAQELRDRGFEVTTTDSNANDDPKITSKDFDLFLSIHYDADIYGKGGGFVDFPEPSTDHATKESQRIKKAIENVYFDKTGVVNHPERSNANTRYYYMWKYLTAKTPCVLIECGVGMHVPDDHQLLHFNRPLVVEAITRGICKAFNVEYEQKPEPEPEPPVQGVVDDENAVIRLGKIRDVNYGDMKLKDVRKGLEEKDNTIELLNARITELEQAPETNPDVQQIKDIAQVIIQNFGDIKMNAESAANDANANRQTLGQVLKLLKEGGDQLDNETVTKAKTIIYGPGWPWDKLSALKKILK